MAKFDPAQIRNPDTKFETGDYVRKMTPLCKTSCTSVYWGLLGKWVKYNENFSSIYTVYTFLVTDLQVRPPGGFLRAMTRTPRPHARVKPF